MTITPELARGVPPEAEAIGVGVFADRMDDEGADLDWAFLAAQGFEGKPGEVVVIPGDGDATMVVVGLGRAEEAEVATFRRAAACVARAAARRAVVATTLPRATADHLDQTAALQAIAEGALLGSYRYTRYKSDPKPSRIERFVLVGPGGRRAEAAVRRGVRVAEAVRFARDLVNEPGGTLTPRAFAQAAYDVAEREGLQITVLDEVDIETAGLGGLLGVNRGSTEPPRLVELAYEPERPRGTVALVGKGVTFDSGGLSLKPADAMVGMKGDMAGAAAVLATMSVVRDVAPRTRVLAYLPLTDNMPGGDAMRVGDVIRIRNGTTVEVLNTDAEGRLILADALSLATEAAPDAVVDLATLTGACMVALGERTAGLMSNHRGFADQVLAAADAAGEAVWPLPLPDEVRRKIDSDVADLKNVADSRYGGALVAGLFLREFVGEGIPWAHLDIAGPAYASDDDGEIAKGGTGFGVRTLVALLAGFRRPRPSER